jgi:hypothetical protein
LIAECAVDIEGELSTRRELYLPAVKLTHPNLGALQVHQDANIQATTLRLGAHGLGAATMVVSRAMGEVQANDIDARINETPDHLGR